MTSGVPQDACSQQIVGKPIYHRADLGLGAHFPMKTAQLVSSHLPRTTIMKRALTNPGTHRAAPSQRLSGCRHGHVKYSIVLKVVRVEIQYTLEALFIFGLGNWIALIIYISRCKAGRQGKDRKWGGRERDSRPSETMASSYNILNLD